VGGVLIWVIPGSLADDTAGGTTYTVRRADLTISVTETGNIKAGSAVDIKSQVERRTTIISLVDEGTYITDQDVKDGKILVELDDSELKEQFTQQEITFESATASLAQAEEAYNIQKNQNESDINQGQMTLRFHQMDLEKYLGQTLADKQIRAAEETDIIASLGELVDSAELGGQASQRLRELQAKIDLAKEELKKAQRELTWTKRLYDQKYVSEDELSADELKLDYKRIEFEQAETALALFRRYDFPKEAAKFYSDYREAGRELERIRARSRSKLAQAQAKRKSQQATYRLQEDRLAKLKKQLDACVIRAPSPGQVVYASSSSGRRRRSQPIEVGAEVHHRMRILELPNTAEMVVETKVHETWVDKVKPDHLAKITIDAFPDKSFTGKVQKVAPLADSQRWWANPDLKVYVTEVSIDGTDDRLRPGMSAKVEIIVRQLRDVIIVPVQVVINRPGGKVVYVQTDNGPEAREVETGEFNDNFIEIVSGLEVGEKVVLTPPRGYNQQDTEKVGPADEPAAGPEKAPPAKRSPGGKAKNTTTRPRTTAPATQNAPD